MTPPVRTIEALTSHESPSVKWVLARAEIAKQLVREMQQENRKVTDNGRG